MKSIFGPAFWRGFASMTAYGALHSVLASNAFKAPVRRVVGERAFGSFFRVGFNAVAAILLLAMLRDALKKPGRTVYEARGIAKAAMWLVGAASLIYALWSAWQIGPGRLSGLGPAARGVAGIEESDPPESQNPTFAHAGRFGIPEGGPFSRHRHPLNFVAPIAFWCFSRGSQSFVGLNSALTLYSVLATITADAKMRARYGRAFEEYAERVPPLLPKLGKD